MLKVLGDARAVHRTTANPTMGHVRERYGPDVFASYARQGVRIECAYSLMPIRSMDSRGLLAVFFRLLDVPSLYQEIDARLSCAAMQPPFACVGHGGQLQVVLFFVVARR